MSSKAKIVLDDVNEVELVINGQKLIVSGVESSKGYKGIVVTAVASTENDEIIIDTKGRKDSQSLLCVSHKDSRSYIPIHDRDWTFSVAEEMVVRSLNKSPKDIDTQRALEGAVGIIRSYQNGTAPTFTRSEEVVGLLKDALILVDPHHVVGRTVGAGICRKCGKQSVYRVCDSCKPNPKE